MNTESSQPSPSVCVETDRRRDSVREAVVRPLNIAIAWEQHSWGGAGASLNYLLEAWPDRRDRIDLYVNRHNEGAARLRTELSQYEHVRIFQFDSVFDAAFAEPAPHIVPRLLRLYLTPAYLLLMVRRYRAMFVGKRYDALISNNGGYPGAWGTLAAILAARASKIPCRILVVNHAAGKALPLMSTFRYLVDLAVSKAVTSIVAISKATKESIQANTLLRYNENVDLRVIYCGVPLKQPGEEVTRTQRARIALAPVPEGDYLLGIVGRVERYKGHEDAIWALSRIDDSIRRKFHLVVIGDGTTEYMSSLKRLCAHLDVADLVHFYGYAEGRVAAFIAQLDLLIVATRSFEGFGLTLAEAMSVGVPVLATSVGAVPEFVTCEAGCTVDPAAPTQMARALESFHRDRGVWLRRAAFAENHVQRFDSRIMASEYRQLIVRTVMMSNEWASQRRNDESAESRSLNMGI